jgi:hypothetical protein
MFCSQANVILMIVYACDVSNMFKCVKICLYDDYMIWDEIWEWLCVLKYDIGNDDLRLFSWVWRYDYEVMFEKCFDEHWIELSFHDVVERMWKEHDAVWTWYNLHVW